MKTKEIRDLIDFIANTGLNEVNIETEELKLSVKRDADVHTHVVENPQVTQSALSQPIPSSTPAASAGSNGPAASAPVAATAPAAEVAAATAPEESSKYVSIKSPMIGTFYRSANPDSEAFVSIGDKVEAGTTVCIIEAMKLFNEIESEISGTIVKVMVDNASPVEYDQELFLVDPT